MTRCKQLLAVLALGALALLASSAFGAAGASAEGLTAVTCVEVEEGVGNYSDPSCKTKGSPFAYETLALHETTEIEPALVGILELSATLFGVSTTITCGGLTGSGDIENVEEAGVMQAHGEEIVFDYTECHVVFHGAAGTTCGVKNTIGNENEGTIQTNPLTAITGTEGAAHTITFAPEEEVLAKFNFTQTPDSTCPRALVGFQATLSGEIDAAVAGAYIRFQGAQENLVVNGSAKGELAVTNTLKMKGGNDIAFETL